MDPKLSQAPQPAGRSKWGGVYGHQWFVAPQNHLTVVAQTNTTLEGFCEKFVQELRDAGFSDADIFAITVYVALRIALSTVNDALGARPDAEFQTLAPAPVREAVTYGRPMDASPRPSR